MLAKHIGFMHINVQQYFFPLFRKLKSAEERFEKIIAEVAEVVTGELKTLDVSTGKLLFLYRLSITMVNLVVLCPLITSVPIFFFTFRMKLTGKKGQEGKNKTRLLVNKPQNQSR